MQKSLNAMETGLRVLSALTNRRNPDPADAEKLYLIAEASGRMMDLDELACEVIQQAIAERKALQKATKERSAAREEVFRSGCQPVLMQV